MNPTTLGLILAAILGSGQLAAQAQLITVSPVSNQARIHGGLDLNGDGIPDFVIGDGSGTEVVQYHSGFDGSLLLSMTSPSGISGSQRFGASVAMAPDSNGDGTPDVVVGAPGWGFGKPGEAFVLSATGAVIHAWTGPSPDSRFGGWVTALGDMDGDGGPEIGVCAPGHDGVPDFAVGEPGFFPITGSGQVRVLPGLDASLIHVLLQGAPVGFFGSALAGIGDVDGDGVPDVAVGASGGAGIVYVFSGATGAMLHSWPAAPRMTRTGRRSTRRATSTAMASRMS